MDKRLGLRHVILFIPLVLAILVFGAFTAVADHVTPAFQAGNPSCPAGLNELKVDPGADGNYSDNDGPLTVTVTVDEGAKEFDWTSNIGVDIVIVKGGPNANVYTYNPESTGDTNLHSPLNEDGSAGWYGLSHISFCYDVETPPPSPSPSVSPSETETPTPTPSDTPTETPSESPSPSVSPTETETETPGTPGTTVSPTSVTTSPSVLGTKVLGNTGADVRNLIYLALALVAMGLLAYTVARRSTKSN